MIFSNEKSFYPSNNQLLHILAHFRQSTTETMQPIALTEILRNISLPTPYIFTRARAVKNTSYRLRLRKNKIFVWQFRDNKTCPIKKNLRICESAKKCASESAKAFRKIRFVSKKVLIFKKKRTFLCFF